MARIGLAFGIAIGLALSASGAQAPDTTALTTLRGVVFDSTVMRPIAAATVQLAARGDVTSGRPYTTSTDSSGAFGLDSVVPGEYVLTFFHPRLELLGLLPPLRAVTVAAARAEEKVSLAIPSAARLLPQLCGWPNANDDSSGAILGVVRSARDGQALAGAGVTVRWLEMFQRSRRRVEVARREVRASAGPDGRFAACGVPANLALELQAAVGKARSGRLDVVVGPRSMSAQELMVDPGDTAASDGVGGRRGTAFVHGIVRSPVGTPLSGARVQVVGSDAVSITNEKGIYALGDVPAGTQLLEARAIGFLPVWRAVNLLPEREVSADIHFDSTAVTLEAVKVVAEGRYERQVAAFEKARRAGQGSYLDERTIAARGGARTTDLLRSVTGVIVRPSSETGGSAVYLRGRARDQCRPTLFVDGIRLEGNLIDIDAMVDPLELVGIAIYHGRMGTPPEFIGRSACGSIVVWTRLGVMRKRGQAEPAVPDSSGVRR